MKKTIVVIGAGKGLGNAVARQFASHDFRVVLISHNQKNLDNYAEEFKNQGYEVYTKVGDALKPATLTTALDEITKELGTPDVLVYNIGITKPDDQPITNEVLLQRYQVDAASAYVVAKHIATPKFAEKHGTILLTGGGFAGTKMPLLQLQPLCIDKMALNAMNILLHAEYQPQGIFVGSILINGVIDPKDDKYAPDKIAQQYWKMYQDKKEYEVLY